MSGDEKGSPNPLSDLTEVLQLRSILPDERLDAVLRITIKLVTYGSVLPRWLGVPIVTSMITVMGSMFLAIDLR